MGKRSYTFKIMIMAGKDSNRTIYYLKVGRGVSTNWLWIVNDNYSLLIGWDYHLKSIDGKKTRYIEIYSVNYFECKAPFHTKDYNIVTKDIVKDVLKAAEQHIDSLTGQLAA